MSCRPSGALLGAALAGLVAAGFLVAAEEPNLTPERTQQFLLTAKVIRSRQLSRGVTAPWRLTLTDGTLTHDAAFQSIDERRPAGHAEPNFRDSYHFNIAAYELAGLLGLTHMMPVTVARKWAGKTGALSWWVTFKWHERDRFLKKLQPPDLEAWNRQIHRVRVFSQLVHDTDRNLGNLLITEDWKVWMIDFTRAFRWHHELRSPKGLVKCDRQLLEKLQQLSAAEVREKTQPHLNASEVKALMKRRDKIVARFDNLIAQKGEDQVLY